MNSFDQELGFIEIPYIFSLMLSNDAKFESVKSDLARPLRIYRQDI